MPKRKTDQVLVGKPHHVATRQISRKTFHSENLPKESQNTSKPKSIAGRKRKTTTTAQSDLTNMNHYEHQCFTSSHVLCLGEGDAGQLGLGEDILSTRFPKLLPQFQQEVSNFKYPICQISAGGMHSVCCSRDNKIYTFGCNDDGALGRICEDDSDEKIPQSVDFDFGGGQILQITTGDSHTAVLTKQGMVFGWGSFRDESGILGLVQALKIEKIPRLLYSPTTHHELNIIKPKTTNKTTNIADSEDRAIKIVSGNNHILILLASGRVLSLGSSEQGQLGRIPARYCCRDQRKGIDVFLNPKPVEFPLRNGRVPRIKDIFATSYGSFAVDALSVPHKIIVYAWGLNNYCQLGLATSTTSKQNRPPIINNKRLKNQIYLIKHDNNENISKTSKIKLSKSVLPTIVYFPMQIKRPWYFLDDGTREICNIVGGPHHTLVLDTQNDIYSFGRSDYGRLGLGPDVGEIVDSPTRITTCNVLCSARNEPKIINNQEINEEISNEHKKSDNEELNNKLDNKPAIKRLKLHANHISATTEKNDGGEKLSNISAISAGECVSYAITNDGQCFSWGMGTTLQLAHAKTPAIKQHSDNANDFDEDEPRDSWYPCCMTGKQLENRKVMQVSAGGQHTLLLTTD